MILLHRLQKRKLLQAAVNLTIKSGLSIVLWLKKMLAPRVPRLQEDEGQVGRPKVGRSLSPRLLSQSLPDERNVAQAGLPLDSSILVPCAPSHLKTSLFLPHILKLENCIPRSPKTRSLACPLQSKLRTYNPLMPR